YVDWLLSQSWFEHRYPMLFERFQSDALLLKIREVEKEKLAAAEKRAHQIRDAREATQQARETRWEQEWLNRHIVQYEPCGIWPLGKYKGRPLAVVARDDAYCAWFKGSAYARMNQQLAADLKLMVETIATDKAARTSVGFHDDGCVAPIWWREAR